MYAIFLVISIRYYWCLFTLFDNLSIFCLYLHMQRDNIDGDGDSLVSNTSRGTASTIVVFQDVLQGSTIILIAFPCSKGWFLNWMNPLSPEVKNQPSQSCLSFLLHSPTRQKYLPTTEDANSTASSGLLRRETILNNFNQTSVRENCHKRGRVFLSNSMLDPLVK